MTKSPPAQRGRRTRRGTDAGPEQWLELPGWRKPLDALLALAVTFSAAWLGLVVIPAAANGGETTIADETVDASGPTADATTDSGQWMAGPVYTGAPAAPTTELATATDTVAAPTTEQREPAPRAVPTRTSSRTAPRSTAPRSTAPRSTAPRSSAPPVAVAQEVVTTSETPTSDAPVTSTAPTTSGTPTSSATETSSSSSETSTSETPTTTSAPATTTAPGGGG